MISTNYKTPHTGERQLRLKFRNGDLSKHTYRASQIRWTDTGTDFDVTHYREEN